MYGGLGDFLSRERRGRGFEVEFELPVGLRDLIQSTGVPHVEVGTATVDGEPAPWSRQVEDGCRVEAHPRYPLASPAETRFLLDVHLGRLAGYMRLVGVDAEHDPSADDPALVERSVAEERTLLTRDRALLMHGALAAGSYVRATDPVLQAIEVVDRFALRAVASPMTRCMVCNTLLVPAERDEVGERVPSSVRERHTEFRHCPGCRRVYWQGSHHHRLQDLVARIVGRSGPSPASP